MTRNERDALFRAAKQRRKHQTRLAEDAMQPETVRNSLLRRARPLFSWRMKGGDGERLFARIHNR